MVFRGLVKKKKASNRMHSNYIFSIRVQLGLTQVELGEAGYPDFLLLFVFKTKCTKYFIHNLKSFIPIQGNSLASPFYLFFFRNKPLELAWAQILYSFSFFSHHNYSCEILQNPILSNCYDIGNFEAFKIIHPLLKEVQRDLSFLNVLNDFHASRCTAH